MSEFESFGKIPRLFRDVIITEKLDGTNAQVYISDDGEIRAGSRKRYITPDDDNFGFAKWVEQNKEELLKLGPGRHFGEWYGSGIQRNYGLNHKRFALFNIGRWFQTKPSCCECVPVIYQGIFSQEQIIESLNNLRENGSLAVPGFMNPEGIIVYHKYSNNIYKVTLDNEDQSKFLNE